MRVAPAAATLVFICIAAAGRAGACTCVAADTLAEVDQEVFEQLRRGVRADGRLLCLYEDGDVPNAHAHWDGPLPAIHVGLTYWRRITAMLPLDESLGSRMARFYAVAATVF